MKTVGLITEYNPFHNGHAWHMQEAKRLSGADFCIVVMSGNFVQRGAPAILDKYARTKMALSCGADLVLELPVPYALGSAEYFASGAVALLDGLGTVDALCFGSECGDISILSETAGILVKEPEGFSALLKERLKSGRTFPHARAEALKEYLNRQEGIPCFDTALLEEPNNILGIEYLKALKRLNSSIVPLTIPRAGGAYHSETPDAVFSSAAALRKMLCPPFSPLKMEMPPAAYDILEEEFGCSCPVVSNDFSILLHYRLLSVSSPKDLLLFLDISPELADRIFRQIPAYTGFEQFTALIKTRQYTESRIRRCLLHILLDIRAEDVAYRKNHGWNSYARVLGFRKKSSSLLHEIKERSRLPLITKLAAAKNILTSEEMHFLQNDIYASQVYQSVVTGKFGRNAYSEYRQPVIVRP